MNRRATAITPSQPLLAAENFEQIRPLYEIAPYDEYTGLSYLIAPPEELLNEYSSQTSWHHICHPESYLLSLGEIGRAVRTSRIQLTSNEDHNFGPITYHSMVRGSKIPKSWLGKIRILTLHAAGAVPDRVFDPRIMKDRAASPEEHNRLMYSGEVRIQSDFSLKRVFTKFTIINGLPEISSEEINQYEDAKDPAEKMSIANSIIGRLLPIVFKPINERYDYAREKGFLPVGAAETPAGVARPLVFDEPERYKFFATELDVYLNKRRAA